MQPSCARGTPTTVRRWLLVMSSAAHEGLCAVVPKPRSNHFDQRQGRSDAGVLYSCRARRCRMGSLFFIWPSTQAIDWRSHFTCLVGPAQTHYPIPTLSPTRHLRNVSGARSPRSRNFGSSPKPISANMVNLAPCSAERRSTMANYRHGAKIWQWEAKRHCPSRYLARNPNSLLSKSGSNSWRKRSLV